MHSTLLLLADAARARRRDWRVTLGFCGVLGSALTLTVVCLSLAWPALWEPLPFPNGDRIVAIRSLQRGSAGALTWRDADDLRERVPSIEKVAVYGVRTWGVQTEPQGHVEVLLSVMTTGEFFDVLGAGPALGSPLTRSHEASGAQNEAWLTNDAAARLFGRTEASLYRTLWVNGAEYRVAGVLPPRFRFPVPQGMPDLFIPLPRAEYCCERGGGAQQAIALLEDRERFDAELGVASASLARDFAVSNADVRFTAAAFREQLFGPRILALRWIVASALCLLTVAAANGAGIWMARWLRTRRELAIRLSLGASVVQLTGVRAVEGAIAGLVAAGAAVITAAALLRVLVAMPLLHDHVESFAVWRPLTMEPAAVWAALMLGTGVGTVAAVLPHLAVISRLRRDGMRESMAPHPAVRVRVVLTAVQLAATAILGWTAIAIGENAHRLLAADRGFETDEKLIAGIGLPEGRYDTDEKMTGFHAAAIAQLRTVPGVISAAGGVGVPQAILRTRFLRDGQTLARERQPLARLGVASPELLPLLGIPVRRGRGFSRDDRLQAPRVALVNEAFVRAHLADADDPLREGLRLSFYNGYAMKPYTRFQIIGIVADARNDGLLIEPQPQIFIPSPQIAMEGFFYFVRTQRPAASIQAELQQAIWRVDRAVERVSFAPLGRHVEQGLADRQALAAFGAIVLIVAAVIVAAGLYSSLSAALSESVRELAIRAALGARPARLAFETLRWTLAASAAAGTVTALALPLIASNVRLEKTVLRPTPISVALCALAMTAVVVAAAFKPVTKAAAVSPAEALREP